MKLYNEIISGNCYKIRLFLSLLNVEHEIVTVDLANGEQKTSSFLKLNPFGEVPVLDDNGFILRDSQAILVYLAIQYGDESWLPRNPVDTARVMQWLSTASNDIARGPTDARLHDKLNLPIDIEKARNKSYEVLQIIEDHLSNREWLELDHPTIADIACFPYFALAHEGGVSIKPYSNVQHWISRIKKLPNFIDMPGLQ